RARRPLRLARVAPPAGVPGRAAVPLARSARARAPSRRALGAPSAGAPRRRGRRGGSRPPAPPPTQLRDAPARHGRRPARDPGAARPRQPLDHAALPGGLRRAPLRGVRPRPSPRAPGAGRRARERVRPEGELVTAPRLRSTTVLGVLRDGRVAIAADGQVSIGNTIVKHGAQKVRALSKGRALVGFAGGAADALALLERLETKLEAHAGNVRRAAVELARDWRTDRV